MTIIHPEHRTDWLTLDVGGTPSIDLEYQKLSLTKQKQYRDAHLKRHYTRLVLTSPFVKGGRLRGDLDPFIHVAMYVNMLRTPAQLGLGIVLEIGLEGDKGAQRKYPVAKMLRVLQTFIPKIDPWIADYKLGVEVEEWASREEIQQLGTTLARLTSKPIWVHFSTPKAGLSPLEWWRSRKGWLGLWAYGIAFQYPKRDKKKPGFLTHPEDMQQWTKALHHICRQNGYQLLPDEYAYRRPMQKAVALGLIGYDITGNFGNGGPVVL